MNQEQPPRRDFLRYVGTMAALSTPALHAAAREENRASFAPIFDKSEKPEKTEPPRDSWDKRVGVAVVGLGRIAIDEMLPAYRSQYEALDRALVSMIRDKKLGTLKECNPVNSQNMGDPQHWRLKKAMAGGGALPDIAFIASMRRAFSAAKSRARCSAASGRRQAMRAFAKSRNRASSCCALQAASQPPAAPTIARTNRRCSA